ncbi:hypothetical protein AHF37_01893 [Paragonimus kellicotti]|nr:hypothetical protein AHF37_01893 [Paragonimus kellicotti]
MMSSASSLEKRRLKDRKRNFNPQWEQDFAFINYDGKPLCLICNISLTHFKSCNLKRHYETHHKKFTIDYPAWSELRRNKLLSLKMARINPHANAVPTDRDTELIYDAGRVITRSVRQTDRLLSNAEFCKQLIARVVVILDPSNTRLHRLITTIPVAESADESWHTRGGCSTYQPVTLTSSIDLILMSFAFQSDSTLESRVPVNGLPGVSTESGPISRLALLRRLLVKNIQRIESASGCFICTACPLPDSTTRSSSVTSCSDPPTFLDHLSTCHHQLRTMVCVYCGWSVHRDQLIPHILRHFTAYPEEKVQTSNASGDMYSCPVEPRCSAQFQTDGFPTMEAHWLSQHPAEAASQSRFKCPHCPRTFASLSLWACHIQRYARRIIHCSAPGCLVKSPSRNLLVEHMYRKHPDEAGGLTSSVLINETIEPGSKRRQLTLETKLHIIRAVENGQKKSDIAREFQIPVSTLSTILSNRGKITAAVHLSPNRKRNRSCPNAELNRRVFDWLVQAQLAGLPLSGPILQRRASQEAEFMNIKGFRASNGWLHKFKKRWNLYRFKVQSQPSNPSMVCNKQEFVPTCSNGDPVGCDLALAGLKPLSLLPSSASTTTTTTTTSWRLPPLPPPPLPANKVGSLELEPKFVFLLRCPHCQMSTVRWQHFLLHSTKCPSTVTKSAIASSIQPGQLPNNSYRCRVYWCSECQAVSTEKDLVTEHAIVIHERLHVDFLDSKVQSATADSSRASFVPGSPSVSSTPVSKTNSFVPFYVNSMWPSSPENDEETESPMNLAALARPAASKLAGPGCRNYQQITSTVPILPSIRPAPVVSTVTTSSWHSIQQTVVSDASSISLLQSAAALKTLQELTGAGGHDVTSEAASAVAAMAAAALSGLTGFDVTSSTASADMLTSINASSLASLTAPAIASVVQFTSPQVSNKADGTQSNGPVENSAPESHGGAEQSSEKPDYDEKCDTGRAGDDLVSFPFDETKFRNELSKHIRSSVLDSLVAKMHQFSSYFVRILGKENHRRIPVCPECDKVFPYGLGDFKRHLLTVHLEVPREYLKDCLRFTYLPKSEEKFQEVQEQLAMRQMKPRLLEAGRRRVPLPYSIIILRRLTRHLPIGTREFLEHKMQLYSRLSVIVDTRGGLRRYRCNHCSYSSPHALADVRKHILGSHCGISTKHFRHCLQASRLDPVEFILFSDEKLARLAKDYMHRQHGSEAFISTGSRSPSPDDGTSHNGFTELDSVVSSTSNSDSEHKPQDTYVSHFTAVVPGSKNRVTVRIRPPVPPDSVNTQGTNAIVGPVVASPSNVNHSPATPPRSPDSPDSLFEPQPANVVDSLDLNTLPSIPGFEGADRVVHLALPFSEPVLRQLMNQAGATKAHMDEILSKMRIYSTYTMSRICKGDRTIAFRCPCGRLFMTTRQPDSKIRAATLADSRRHVMGVHARIPHEFITLCCQASRITREYDFEIYPDDMLLRLAMDRPIKLTNLPPASCPVSRPSSSLPPLRPLRDLGLNASASGKYATTEDNFEPSQSDTMDNSVSVDNSEAQSVSSADGFGGPRDSIEDERLTIVEDKESPESNDKKTSKGMEDPLSHLSQAQASPNEEVERVIDLPYSSEALHSLVEGYCPPSYFPILEEKMDVYSSLKVFISRRRGRRYFCCSGCSSSSPHGMGDIRKHILGVHAKVPERYKAAAMHCSRLSREDNTLLPNHVLLHLAKMKWKGTVIKPLAEMDLSQFGARRASAVGLVRQTGQFASQVYQPSTQHRDSEKLTALPSAASTTSAGHRSSATGSEKFRNSLYSTVASCTFDDQTEDAEFDLVSEPHERETGNNESDEAQPYIIRMNADPSRKITEGCALVYACSACPFLSNYAGAARAHIVRTHMHVPAYDCPHCDQTFQTNKDAFNHHQTVHTKLEFTVDQHRMIYRDSMSKISITDIESEPVSRVTELKQLLRARASDSEKRPEDAGDREDDVSFEAEIDYEEFSTALDQGNCDLGRMRYLPDTTELGKPAKIARLDTDSTSTLADDLLDVPNGNPDMTRPMIVLNGLAESGKFASPIARSGPSGSSRRKPSKLQLVQLKPTLEPENCDACPTSGLVGKPDTCGQESKASDKLILNVSEI